MSRNMNPILANKKDIKMVCVVGVVSVGKITRMSIGIDLSQELELAIGIL